MPDISEIDAGMGEYTDFIPAHRPEEQPDLPKPGACHLKINCKNCGTLMGHFRVEGDRHFIQVEIEPFCRECLVGLSLNQNIEVVKDEN